MHQIPMKSTSNTVKPSGKVMVTVAPEYLGKILSLEKQINQTIECCDLTG